MFVSFTDWEFAGDVDKAVEGKKSKADCDKGMWCSEHALHGYRRKYP